MKEHKQAAIAYIDENQQIFTELSAKIWENPEISLKEYKSAAFYIEVLEKYGFEVERNLGGIETAFKATYGHGKPVIGFLGEYDALSGMSQKRGSTEHDPIEVGGLGHGCGHNMLGTGDLAAAFAVKDYLEKTGREGTVIFYGCPGEEGGASKAFFARDNMWTELDAALTWHPADVNEIVSGTNNSTVQVLYEYKGVSAHAAGDPYNGRSALDAVELMNIGVQFLREHTKDDCRIHYSILDAGGSSPNVVQDHASVLYMVRAIKVADTVKLMKRVDKIADGAALMTETSYERTFIDGTADVIPNFTLEELAYRNFEEVGMPEYSEEELAFAEAIEAHCPDNTTPGISALYDAEVAAKVREWSNGGTRALNNYLIPLVHTLGFHPGSTDVGDVSWQTPTVQIRVAAFAGGAPGHSWQNVAMGGSTIGDKALLQAGKVLACSAIELFEQPEILKKAKNEFDMRTAEGYVCPIEEGAVPIAL